MLAVPLDAFYVRDGRSCLRADYNLFKGEPLTARPPSSPSRWPVTHFPLWERALGHPPVACWGDGGVPLNPFPALLQVGLCCPPGWPQCLTAISLSSLEGVSSPQPAGGWQGGWAQRQVARVRVAVAAVLMPLCGSVESTSLTIRTTTILGAGARESPAGRTPALLMTDPGVIFSIPHGSQASSGETPEHRLCGPKWKQTGTHQLNPE